MLERHLALVFIARHNHTCYPEEDDIRTGYEVGGRVVVLDLFVIRVLDAVEQTDRPEPGAEPGIQRSFVLNPFHLCTLYIVPLYIRVTFSDQDLIVRIVLETCLRQQVRVVIRRDTVAPPELATDTPVFDVLQPVAVGVLVLRRIEHDVVVHYGRQRDICEMLHLHEPLQTQARLDRYVRTLGIAYFVVIVLDFLHEVQGLQVLYDLFAAVEAVHAVVLAYVRLQLFLYRVHVEVCVRREDIDGLEVVFLTEHVVVYVVRRRHLEATGTESDLHVAVLDDRYHAAYARYNHMFALQPLVLLFLRVDTYGDIAEDSLRTGGRYDRVFGRIFSYAVAQVVELRVLLVVYHLLVTKRRLTLRIPVDHTQAAVDEAFVIQVAEHFDDGAGALLVHREGRAVPIAGTA